MNPSKNSSKKALDALMGDFATIIHMCCVFAKNKQIEDAMQKATKVTRDMASINNVFAKKLDIQIDSLIPSKEEYDTYFLSTPSSNHPQPDIIKHTIAFNTFVSATFDETIPFEKKLWMMKAVCDLLTQVILLLKFKNILCDKN